MISGCCYQFVMCRHTGALKTILGGGGGGAGLSKLKHDKPVK